MSDYVTERNDKQNRRINRKGKILKKRKLKEDAVPSVWPGLPAHLTRTPTVPRKTTRTSSEARTAAVEAMLKSVESVEIENDRVIRDSFSSLEELKTKINEINLPATTQVIEKDSAILFISVSIKTLPEIDCLFVNECLEYKLWSRGKELKKNTVRIDNVEVLPPLITSIDLLGHLLLHFEVISTTDEDRRPPSQPDVLQNAIEILQNSNSNFRTDSKVSFIIEQLSMLQRKPTARRYSSSLLAFAMMLSKTSPAAYKQLLREEIFFLPSIRHLQHLTSSMDNELRLGETAINYLKARLTKLGQQDRLVSLIFDEVYTQKRIEYVGGRFYGMDMENEHATKTICPMVRSVAGSYRDIVAMSPVDNLNAKKQTYVDEERRNS